MVAVACDYERAMLRDTIVMSVGDCDNAHALLSDQERRFMSSGALKKADSFYCVYKYGRETCKRQQHRVLNGKLMIPRHIWGETSVHRLVLVNLFKCKMVHGIAIHYLQLSYEDVPSQCRCSRFFYELTAKIVAKREALYGKIGHMVYSCPGSCEDVDSDGAANIVKLAVAAKLAEWFGPGASAQVGRGGYPSSHKGMVHALLRLTPELFESVKALMEKNSTLDGGKTPKNSGFLRVKMDFPRTTTPFIPLGISRNACYTYRSVMSNARKHPEAAERSKPGDEMTLLPIPAGVITIGRLGNAYHRKSFRKNKSKRISC